MGTRILVDWFPFSGFLPFTAALHDRANVRFKRFAIVLLDWFHALVAYALDLAAAFLRLGYGRPSMRTFACFGMEVPCKLSRSLSWLDRIIL